MFSPLLSHRFRPLNICLIIKTFFCFIWFQIYWTYLHCRYYCYYSYHHYHTIVTIAIFSAFDLVSFCNGFSHCFLLFGIININKNITKCFSTILVFNRYSWWRYTDDIFVIWKHGEKSLNLFLWKINAIHPTIMCTADWVL